MHLLTPPIEHFVFELNRLSAQHTLNARANDFESGLAHHLHNRPADDLFQGLPDELGIGGIRRQIAQVPAAMGQAGARDMKSLTQLCGNAAQGLFSPFPL